MIIEKTKILINFSQPPQCQCQILGFGTVDEIASVSTNKAVSMVQESSTALNCDPSYLKSEGQCFAPAIAEPGTEISQLNKSPISTLKSEEKYLSPTAEVDNSKLVNTSPFSPVVSDEKSQVSNKI